VRVSLAFIRFVKIVSVAKWRKHIISPLQKKKQIGFFLSAGAIVPKRETGMSYNKVLRRIPYKKHNPSWVVLD